MMKCPNCGFEQQAAELDECLKCHIIFSKWNKIQAERPSLPNCTVTKSTKPKTDISIWVVAVALFLAMLMAFPLLNRKGLPIPAGAYRDETYEFAISAPPEWIRFTKANYQAVLSEYADKLPLLKGADTNNLAVGFIKIEKDTLFSPSVNIIALKGQLPELTESEKDKAAQSAASVMSRRFSDYKQESVDIIEVDKLKSLQILSTASLKMPTGEKQFTLQKRGIYRPNPNAYKKYALKYWQIVVPGGEYFYILTFTALADVFDEQVDSFKQILASFRVINRPVGFWGSIFDGSVRAGIAWGCIAFFILAWRRRKR